MVSQTAEGQNQKLRKESFIVRATHTADDGVNRTATVRTGQNLGETVDGVRGGPWMEINSDPQALRLLERVVESGNMKQAWKQVKSNRGGKGIDGRTIADTEIFLKIQWPVIRQSILDERFQPSPVKRVEIPKPGGGMRKLGIPTVVDRLIQQAICQTLTPIFDPKFSEFSYGFRPKRSAHDAVRQVRKYQESGKQWVVDMDLKQFFDEVNHDVLMARVGRRVKDKRLKRLINAYLKSGVIATKGLEPTVKGTPQGGPLSPLLSNILLDDLDKELEKRGHSFCRYCDDFNIYVATQQAGERVMGSITAFLEDTLKLKVNHLKSAVDRPWKRKFLGFSSYKMYGKIRTSVPKVTLARIRARTKILFRQGRSRNVAYFISKQLNPVLRGWLQYFSLGTSRRQLIKLDYWIRRKLRCILWRQWKRAPTRLKKLRSLGINDDRAFAAYSRKGPWPSVGHPALRHALSPAYFRSLGLYILTDHFNAMRTTST